MAMCSASFPLCFSSPTRIGLVSPTPERNFVILRRHSSFAVCFQVSTLSNFLRHSCHQTSTSPRYQLSRPAQRQPSILPSGRLRSDGLSYIASFPHASPGFFGHSYLPGFFCPWSSLFPIIFVQTDYFDLDFFFSLLTWHQELVLLTKESMGLMWFVNLRLLFRSVFFL